MERVILIGDSIRMHYEPIVKRELAGLAEVWGPETNGKTSRKVLKNLDKWAGVAAAVVHVNCGLHDLAKDLQTGAPQVTLKEYEVNVRKILRRLLKGRHGQVIWATTTPVNEQWHHANKGFDRFESDVVDYNAAAKRVADDLGVTVNDLNVVITKAGADECLKADGVHYTEAGCELLGKTVAGFVKPFLGE